MQQTSNKEYWNTMVIINLDDRCFFLKIQSRKTAHQHSIKLREFQPFYRPISSLKKVLYACQISAFIREAMAVTRYPVGSTRYYCLILKLFHMSSSWPLVIIYITNFQNSKKPKNKLHWGDPDGAARSY